ncbi:DUF1266 domain-containing protein [Modicisalibacter luteus]|uniref:DUF1266 domain-containing protein n=1 Tax=Modicisalibacter luteus TaxID=453962 RepID=A0ABV7LZC5_9GAMM|nr:DUF1266 domain-containing protein [Halomonas lutea]GHB05106.1 hypothetical protein GCM10007159_28690 [Halomonas lutea]
MADPLKAWWAQQLVLCGWAFEPDPTDMEPTIAVARLAQLGVVERGELGWRLLEAFPPGVPNPQFQLAALELIALAASAGWLTNEQTEAWVQRVAKSIHAQYASLDEWLAALKKARLEEGWSHGDEEFALAGEALAQLEHQGDGITWEVSGVHLNKCRNLPLWPEQENERTWALRAIFAPVLALPPQPERDWPDVTDWLENEWQIRSREELIRILLWLGGQGHRYGWDQDAARLLDADVTTRQSWLRGLNDQRRYGQVMLAYLEQGEPLEWAAWDWLRLVDLAYAGLMLGWLRADEAEDFAAHAADLLMRRYSDWMALVQAYQRGRSLFEGHRYPTDQAVPELALLMNSPVSPWRVPLQGLVTEVQRERSRLALRRWRSDTRHWVLALASVREPDLLYRQGIGVTLDEARRQDARRYLAETLGLFPDEGVDGLARYWLPAQSHHLNQLAIDAAHGALPPLDTDFGRPSEEAIHLRERLQSCVRHAATIHMAEKYAFYLLMAGDSGDFDAAGLARVAESLRGVLCRLYPNPKRLLEAWAAWEAALPELPEDTLVYDIRWHRDDPGSPFHWLDWRQAEWQEPGPRPSLTRLTALSLAGPLNPGIWGEPQRESRAEREALQQWLDSHYGLHSPEGLQEFLGFLLEVGDRQEYQINYAPYTLNRARLEEEIAILESGECGEEERNHLLRLRRVRDNEAGCNDIDMTAWDLAQAVDLAIAGRSLDWVSTTLLDDVLDTALAEAQRHYGNWRDYALGLYAGFAFFMGETEERESFLARFREGLTAWLSGAPPLAGSWASLDFPGARPRHWAPLHIDTLPGDARTMH